ncbi:hypothetical protein CNBA7170 [Cryptococcus deneoformans B-3501A]|uniref:hypothetical protein n=1 Tax=Cryptococcus deneoformans (strain B-3501A) TaxID=283643 RepID=UPI000042DEAF|nr:hypothetical protein CNBA7170 [Cryptococcus neoformans var. neoformans B-3501A]EAL22949.1 hypothetical protein CNBA7170 [Cryptococcus neoformans var. neoformans B-3501A]
MPTAYPVPTQMLQQLWDRFTAWVMRSYPIRDSPLNIRPAMVFATALWVIMLGILGMAPLPELPVNDKALHFFGMGFATFLIYFVIEAPEGPGRRVWYIRQAPLILTLFLSFFWKTFQSLDILANLIGSSVFLYLAHLAHKRHLRKQEISSLYEPLSAGGVGRYRDAQGREHAFDVPSSSGGGSGSGGGRTPRGVSYANAGAGGDEWRGQRGRGTIWDEESESESVGRGSVETERAGGQKWLAAPVFKIDDEDEETEGRVQL